MIDKIKEYVFKLFESAPQTSRVNEAKEELLAGCIDKYNDLINSGKTDVEAYSEVISGIGDVNELLSTIIEIDKTKNFEKPYSQKSYNSTPKNTDLEIFNLKKKRRTLISTGIFMFIFGFIVPTVISILDLDNLRFSIMLMFLLWSIALFLIIYGITSTRLNENMENDDQIPSKGLRGPITSTLWCITVILYLFLSFITFRWDVTWLIFMFATIIQMIINYIFSPVRHHKGHMISILWTSCVFFYLFISMATFRWDITWILFPIAVGIQQIIILYHAWRKSK